jgi:pyruvate dehydrogenase (quinone)
MGEKVGDFILRRLREWGVRRVFAYPGDGINGLLGAFERAGDNPQFIQARHEELAAFMACAHAKFTDEAGGGGVGVCMATAGPGAIHLLNGLYDAKMDHQPVVAIVGQAARSVLGGEFQQEVNLTRLFNDVCAYVYQMDTPVQARQLIDRAFRIALAERTVTCVIVPKDIQEMSAIPTPPHAPNTVHTSLVYKVPRVVPQEKDLRQAADILNEGKRVAILIGAGAMHASKEVTEVADLLGAGVAKALLGKAALPDTLPFVTGSIGLLGTKPSWDMMMGCDTLLMVGSNFPYSEFLPKEGQARGVQIDISGRRLSLRYPMEMPLQGDSAETLRALIPYLKRKTDRSWREKIEANIREWWKVVDDRAMESANPINPQRVFYELNRHLPDNCILTSDSGTSADWYARQVQIRGNMLASLSGNLATMGCGVPYATAAKFAHPDRPVVAVVGDGAMEMNGLNGLITIAKYWQRWSNPLLIVQVLNNRDLNQVTWELRIESGDPKFNASQDIPDFPYASFADSIGLKGIRVSKPEELSSAWEAAFASDRPVVFEAYTDPNVPPLPPHISFEEAKHFSEALLKGDPDERGIIIESIKGLAAEVLPRLGIKR